ncbi:MAG: hypothetical protein H3C43_08025 [Leptonema sp. (in: Bacteria)]|nr:hypothetical protein [Leptonema sp. (in: bacteria)]
MFALNRVIAILVGIGFVFGIVGCKDQGQTIETIGKDKITTEKFETYYTAYIEKASRLANADKETLYRLMCHPEQIPQDPQARDMIAGLIPENNYEKFRDMKIIEQAAVAEGFQDRPDIKAILDQVYLEALAQLYFQEKMQAKIKISETDKETKCQELRSKHPAEMAGRTLEECLKMGESAAKMELFQVEYPRLRSDIKESVQIKKNNDFDRDDYLKNKLKLYQDIRKTGGCSESSTTITPSNEPNLVPAIGK